jgi:hypothetical protein
LTKAHERMFKESSPAAENPTQAIEAGTGLPVNTNTNPDPSPETKPEPKASVPPVGRGMGGRGGVQGGSGKLFDFPPIIEDTPGGLNPNVRSPRYKRGNQ